MVELGTILESVLPVAGFVSVISASFSLTCRMEISRGPIGGRLTWTQNKTGVPHRAALSPTTMDALQRLHAGKPPQETLVPWIDLDTCFRWIKKAVTIAGLSGGTKKIRRGSASEVERRNPGAGWKHLGHTAPGLDRQFYLDPNIAYQETISPPEL